MKTPPKVKGHFLLGSLLEARRSILDFLLSSAMAYGDIFQFKIGVTPFVFVNKPDYVKHVLHNPHIYQRGRQPAGARQLFGQGLIVTDGELWKEQRRLIQPFFSRQHVAPFSALITEYTVAMLESWPESNRHKGPINIAAEMMNLTTQIIAAIVFGRDQVKDTSRFIENLTVLEEMILQREFGVGRFFTWAPTPANRKFNRAIQSLREETLNYVIRCRDGDRGKCLLSMLADPRNEKELTDRELCDQALTFIQAGHETTATSLNWLFYFLSRNPAVERKLRSELAEELNGATVQVEDLDRLVYLEMVVHETLRILPSAGLTFRQALQDDVIDGFAIPKRSFVMMSPYVIQRTAAHWENPNVFEPERFTPNRVRERHPYSYFPFLRGAHQCIGQQFALMEIRLIAATVLQKYELELVSDEELRPTTIPILKIPKNCMLMNLKPCRSAAALAR